MKRARITLAAVAAWATVLAAQGAAASGPEPGATLPTGLVLVSINEPGSRAATGRALTAVGERNDLRVEGRSVQGGFIAVDPQGEDLAELRERLGSDPRVTSVRPEQRAEFRFNPDDPAFLLHDPNAPFDDFAQWNLGYAGFPRAWELGHGEGGEVAILDSGIYADHPDLTGRVAGAINCAGITCLGTDVTDGSGHGTHVAGLACADSNNGYGLASGGFDCSLYAVKLDLGYTSIINSIYAAVEHGSDAINMSFGGGGPDPELKEALEYAWQQGSIPVAAAANEPVPSAPVNYPAQYIQPEGTGQNIDAGMGLVVTSAKYSGARSAFAQRTAGVSIAAFGSASDLVSGGQQGILSTWPPEVPEPSIDSTFENTSPPTPVRTTLFGDNRFAYLAGTSMATPQVSGLVALLRAARPAMPAAKVVRLIKLTAADCGEYGHAGLGWGLINADIALGAALDRDMDAPGSRVRSVRRGGGAKAKVRLKRFDDSCSPELPHSGLKSVTVFASVNGRPYRELRKTRKKSFVIRVKPGRRYRFYSVATDRADNHESVPETPDAKLKT